MGGFRDTSKRQMGYDGVQRPPPYYEGVLARRLVASRETGLGFKRRVEDVHCALC